jgi:hypothetical protein
MQAIGSTRPGGHVGFVGVSHGVEIPGEQLETGCLLRSLPVGLRGSSGRYPRNLVGLFQLLTQSVIFDGQALDVRYCDLKVLGEVLVVMAKPCDVFLERFVTGGVEGACRQCWLGASDGQLRADIREAPAKSGVRQAEASAQGQNTRLAACGFRFMLEPSTRSAGVLFGDLLLAAHPVLSASCLAR